MRKILLGSIALTISLSSMADNVTVYRWVDKNNVVHFSQKQPSHDNYTELTMSAVSKSKTTVTNKESDEEADAKDKKALALIPSTEECEEAKANVRVLKTYDKIQYSDDKGAVKILDATAKQQQLELNEKKVEIYCK